MIKLKNRKLRWFFNNYIRTKINLICLLIVLIFIGISIGNTSPLIFGKMIDIIGNSNLNELLHLIILYFIVTVITKIISIIEDFIGQTVSFGITKETQKDLFKKIITLNQKSLQNYESGELISRLNGDADSVVNFFIDIITSIIQIIINTVISLYFILYISKHLSVVALFYIPASLLVNLSVRKYYKRLTEKRKKFSDSYFSFISEVFNNGISIKSFNLQNRINNRYKDFVSKEYKLLKNSILLSNIVGGLTTLISVSSSLFIIYYSAILIDKGLLSIGLMVSFNTYINKLFDSINQILSLNIQKQEIEVCIERLTEILLDYSEDEISGNKLIDSKLIDYNSISVNNVSFGYDERKAVLLNLNFKIDKQGFYSLVGKNGCGKSTIAKLLIRLYDTDKGSVTVGGNNIRECCIHHIRDNISYIQKEDFFFNDTISNNLKLANENISEIEVQQVCKNVGIDKDILSLCDGYNTLMGEGGDNFSSGQKQKLSIARSLLRKSNIYIYDEATANLDGSAEKMIIDFLLELSKNSIVIFISHKVSSIIKSDKIFVIDKGSVIAEGKHEQLIEKCQLYNEIFYSTK